MLSLRQSFRELVRRVGEDASRRRVDVQDHDSRARAIELLKQNLSPAQREQFEKRSYFDVVGGDTGRNYRIREGCQMSTLLTSLVASPSSPVKVCTSARLFFSSSSLSYRRATRPASNP